MLFVENCRTCILHGTVVTVDNNYYYHAEKNYISDSMDEKVGEIKIEEIKYYERSLKNIS